MASKRPRTKTTAGRRRATYDSSIFESQKAADKYEELSLRKFTTERCWKIDKFTSETEIEGVEERINWRPRLEELGLANLVEFNGEFVPNLVREFYANATQWSVAKGEEFVESWVRGVNIRITPQTLVEIFGLQLRDEFYEKTSRRIMDTKMLKPTAPFKMPRMRAGWLKGEYVPLLKSLCANIMPITNDKEYDRERMTVAFTIASGIPYNIPAIIIHQLIGAITTGVKKTSLPFPGLITEILNREGVMVDAFEKGSSRLATDITPTTVIKAIKAIRAQERGAAQAAGAGQAAREEAESDDEGEEMTMPAMAKAVKEIEGRLTRIEEHNARVEEHHAREMMFLEDAYRVRRMHYPEYYEGRPDYTSYDQPGTSGGPTE